MDAKESAEDDRKAQEKRKQKESVERVASRMGEERSEFIDGKASSSRQHHPCEVNVESAEDDRETQEKRKQTAKNRESVERVDSQKGEERSEFSHGKASPSHQRHHRNVSVESAKDDRKAREKRKRTAKERESVERVDSQKGEEWSEFSHGKASPSRQHHHRNVSMKSAKDDRKARERRKRTAKERESVERVDLQKGEEQSEFSHRKASPSRQRHHRNISMESAKDDRKAREKRKWTAKKRESVERVDSQSGEERSKFIDRRESQVRQHNPCEIVVESAEDNREAREKRKRTAKEIEHVKRFALQTDEECFEMFYGEANPFSQHYRCEFSVDDIPFNCGEQYMMYRKAVLFDDWRMAEQILASDKPCEHKQLGRRVRNFDARRWDYECYDIVKCGNMAKFQQNPDLCKKLLSTVGKTLVEANPFDRKWGIGLSARDPAAKRRDQWKGRNLLGQILTDIREELCKEANSKEQWERSRT